MLVPSLKKVVPGCGARTEEVKVRQATIDSANYTKRGFNVAVWALVITLISAAISFVAILK